MKNIILITALLSLELSCSNSQNKPYDNNASVGRFANNDTCHKIDEYLMNLASEKNFSGGLLIIKDGKEILCKGYGWADKEKKIYFTPSVLTSIGSITKAFTATGIMKLVEQNKLSLDDQLVKFFPSIPSDKAKITVHQLLTHSSGFHEFLTKDGGDYEKINTEDFLKRAFSEPLAFTPGEKAIYTNVGMSILGIIIEKVSGQEYETYLRRNVFEPIGIKNIGYHFPNSLDDTLAIGYQNGKSWGTHQEHFTKAGGGPYWNLKANGGLEVSLNEMELWINSFTNATVLNEASIQKMFTAHIQEEGNGDESFFGYGCNISKSRRNTKMISNGGSNGIYFARIVRLPEEGLVFYMVTNESSINTNMVLPNVTQLYFQGKITQDAITLKQKFEGPLEKRIYDLLITSKIKSLETELEKENIQVDNDMMLLNVGRVLLEEKKNNEALILYQYYTKAFPNIIVAWNDMGDVYQLQNNKEEAIKCYKQALKLRPENPRAKENLEKLTK
ncbi:MAG: serine hydrolase [Saprospiraceae bacterium]